VLPAVKAGSKEYNMNGLSSPPVATTRTRLRGISPSSVAVSTTGMRHLKKGEGKTLPTLYRPANATNGAAGKGEAGPVFQKNVRPAPKANVKNRSTARLE
ncbi:MAG: hypothetical protein Q8O40_05530, partial [Chloroflexota bacterium]|nr:hypothetical protein [Chloroflexota bacterium]